MPSLSKQFIIVTVPTLISRIAGFFRDLIIASIFGSTGMTDLFFIALRAPNILRRLFGEGTLSQSVVPILAKADKKEFESIVKSLNSIGILLLLLISAAGAMFPGTVISVLAPGILGDYARSKIAFDMIRISFPYLFFIGFSVLIAASLNAKKRFLIPAASPIMLNAAIITAALTAYIFHLQIIVLCWGIIAGGIIQLAMHLAAALFYRIPLLLSFKINDNLKLIGKRMIPALAATGAMQISTWADTIIASFLKQGAISTLFYANRITQLPFALIAISFSTILIPHLSSKSGEVVRESARDMLPKFIVLFFLISFFIVIAGKLITGIIFERGAFSVIDTQKVYYALIFYAPSLFAYSIIRIITPLFYAEGDTKTPSRLSIIGVVLTIIFAIILSIGFGYVGIAAGTSIGATVNLIMLIKELDKRGVRLKLPIIRMLLFVMIITILIVFTHHSYPALFIDKLFQLVLFAAIFFGLSMVFFGKILKKLLQM